MVFQVATSLETCNRDWKECEEEHWHKEEVCWHGPHGFGLVILKDLTLNGFGQVQAIQRRTGVLVWVDPVGLKRAGKMDYYAINNLASKT